ACMTPESFRDTRRSGPWPYTFVCGHDRELYPVKVAIKRSSMRLGSAMQSWCEGDDDEASASLCDQAQVDSKLTDADLAGCTMPSQRTRIGHRSYRARPPWDYPAAPRIASVRGRARIGYRIAVCRHEGRTPSGPAATLAAMDPRTPFPVGRP